MRAKICGITRVEDVQLAIEKGAWALGFNFYAASARYIEPQKAKLLIEHLPKDSVKIGVVIGYSEAEQLNLMQTLSLDYLQVYSHIERPLDVTQRMILSLQVDNEAALPDPSVLQSYAAILLDAPKTADGLYGGTGRASNWALAVKLAKTYPLILAGGLQPQNVAQAIAAVHPYAVDVASGIESEPGIKDPIRMSQFLEECQRVN
ncbi:MAG: phosphoribosylanthranilate isomerase [Gammaproteobacteria bacterium]|nr:phosphoribosylanthranilate isomerase [Gammaproteobacteria bacterium]